jgi:rhamnosyltransferase
MTGASRTPLAAGIVAYRPDPGLLARLISSLAPQVDLLLLYRNSSIPAHLFDLAQIHVDRIRVIGNGRNLGLGVAYNRIVDAAMACGIERILLFDQDSSVPLDLGAALLSRMQCLIEQGERPAVVGPRPITSDDECYKIPRRSSRVKAESVGANLPLQFVISSGSLIDGASFRDIGPFRDDFFIDGIDIEWCLRAGSRGYSCWMATDVPMEHRLGAGVVRMPLSGAHIVRQPPTRVYTLVRNQLALLRLGHVPVEWKARVAARLVVHTVGQAMYSSHRTSTVRALARGWRDGLLGRLGPPVDALGSALGIE